MIELYKKFNSDKEYTSIGLFRELNTKFKNIKRVLYPGSYVHITPSLIFKDVTYIDSCKNTYKFYESIEVKNFIFENKEYSWIPIYDFYQQDYKNDINETESSFDVIISQYCGFAWRDTKKYLKKWWFLVCNNSHWDASMASYDPDYKLIAVYNRKSDNIFSICDKNLENYLIPKNINKTSKEILEKTMRGFDYTKSPSGYIFEKL